MATVINGKKIAAEIQEELRKEVEEWTKLGNRKPCLMAILVGEDPASVTYVNKKMEAAKIVGITSETINLPTSITETELIAEVEKLNANPEVDGILVQLPVPGHISERDICNAVDPKKDVDGFHINNIGRVCVNMDAFVPCTVLGVMEIIKRAGIETFSRSILIAGRSKNIGLPLTLILHSDARNSLPGHEATVTLAHRHTPASVLRAQCLQADIIISATGVPGLIRADMVKPGAAVLDVGITRVKVLNEQGEFTGREKLVGDVEYDEVKKVAGWVTPVPGGVGPMTVAMLMKNTIRAAKLLQKRKTSDGRNGI